MADTTVDDVIYMDPPYQGTSYTRDHRYYGGLGYNAFADALRGMNEAGKSYIVSYDGRTGTKKHGEPLPRELGLRHLHIHVGRSSQSTLLGRDCETVESLYISPALVERLNGDGRQINETPSSENWPSHDQAAERVVGLADSVQNRRARTGVDHVLQHGEVTTERCRVLV